MKKETFKKALNNLYSACGLNPVMIEEVKNKYYHIQKFIHPTQRKIIDVSYSLNGRMCVSVYCDTANAAQKNAVWCKTIEQFIEEVS